MHSMSRELDRSRCPACGRKVLDWGYECPGCGRIPYRTPEGRRALIAESIKETLSSQNFWIGMFFTLFLIIGLVIFLNQKSFIDRHGKLGSEESAQSYLSEQSRRLANEDDKPNFRPGPLDQINRPGCITISARNGWKQLHLGENVDEVSFVNGGWSIDPAIYPVTGPDGHIDAEADRAGKWDAYKIDNRGPIGALLLAIDSKSNMAPYPRNTSGLAGRTVYLRINERDQGLHNNIGNLVVCFE